MKPLPISQGSRTVALASCDHVMPAAEEAQIGGQDGNISITQSSLDKDSAILEMPARFW